MLFGRIEEVKGDRFGRRVGCGQFAISESVSLLLSPSTHDERRMLDSRGRGMAHSREGGGKKNLPKSLGRRGVG